MSQTLYWNFLLTYNNLGHLYKIHNLSRKAIRQHTGHLKQIFIFANKQVIYSINPSVHAVYFQLHQKLVQYYGFRNAVNCLVFMLTVCRIGDYEGRILLLWIRKSTFLRTRADKTSKQSEPNSKFIDVNEFLSLDFCKFWMKSYRNSAINVLALMLILLKYYRLHYCLTFKP